VGGVEGGDLPETVEGLGRKSAKAFALQPEWLRLLEWTQLLLERLEEDIFSLSVLQLVPQHVLVDQSSDRVLLLLCFPHSLLQNLLLLHFYVLRALQIKHCPFFFFAHLFENRCYFILRTHSILLLTSA